MYEERIIATEKKFTEKVKKLEAEKDAEIATVREKMAQAMEASVREPMRKEKEKIKSTT